MVKTVCFVASAALASAGFASYAAPAMSSFSTGASYSTPLASTFSTGAALSSPAVAMPAVTTTSVENVWHPATQTQSQSMNMPKYHKHINTHVHQEDVQNDKVIHNYQTSANQYKQAPGREIHGSVSQVNHGSVGMASAGNLDMGSIGYQTTGASSFSSGTQVKFVNTHYGDPSTGCMTDETEIHYTTMSGDGHWCAPSCGSACPTDVPIGCKAIPFCAIQLGPNLYCALNCKPFSTDQCGKGTCKAFQSTGICTYK